MPQKIDSFLAWQLLWYLYRELQTIRRANGYNTDPKVTMDYEEMRQSQAKHTLLLESDGHDAEQHAIGESQTPRVYQVLQVIVVGLSRVETEIPRKLAMSLEQDVRTALAAAKTGVAAGIGRNFRFRFGSCTHDAGVLAPDERAGFRLRCSWMYPQGKTW